MIVQSFLEMDESWQLVTFPLLLLEIKLLVECIKCAMCVYDYVCKCECVHMDMMSTYVRSAGNSAMCNRTDKEQGKEKMS